MRIFVVCFIMYANSLYSQQSIKIKREDNRFLFFQVGKKNDTIIQNSSDLFLIKLPDSLKTVTRILVENGKFIITKKDSIFKLQPILGMKYSHSKSDSIFNTLLEGVSSSTKSIIVKIFDTKTNKALIQNTFIVK